MDVSSRMNRSLIRTRALNIESDCLDGYDYLMAMSFLQPA